VPSKTESLETFGLGKNVIYQHLLLITCTYPLDGTVQSGPNAVYQVLWCHVSIKHEKKSAQFSVDMLWMFGFYARKFSLEVQLTSGSV